MKTFTCEYCGSVNNYEPCILAGVERFRPHLCPPCIEKATEESRKAEERQRQARLTEGWERICPASYQATSPDFPLMNRDLLAGLMRYNPASGRGIGLWGTTGLRKTRMMFLLLKKLHFGGTRVFAASAKRLAGCFSVMFGKDNESGKARDVIRKCYSAEVLFLDDLGKQAFTEHGQAEFFHLIEERTSRLKPILWTANATGDELAGMMSPDRGEPIVRRLVEFCEVIGVGLDEIEEHNEFPNK